MKIFIIALGLIFIKPSFANKIQDFYKMGCTFTGQYSDWYINSKIEKGSYEVTIQNRPRNEKGIININSVSFEKKGVIGPYIFLKHTNTKKMKTNSGFDIDVKIFNESKECAEFYFRNIQLLPNSYPLLPKVWEEVQKEEQKNREKATQDRLTKLLEKEKKELLKKITLKGYEKFKAHGCYYIGGSTWRTQFADNGQPPKHILVDIPTIDFLVKYNEGSDYVKDTGKTDKSQNYSKPLPLYADMGCKKIVNSNLTKKSLKKKRLKKKSKSLYE